MFLSKELHGQGEQVIAELNESIIHSNGQV